MAFVLPNVAFFVECIVASTAHAYTMRWTLFLWLSRLLLIPTIAYLNVVIQGPQPVTVALHVSTASAKDAFQRTSKEAHHCVWCWHHLQWRLVCSFDTKRTASDSRGYPVICRFKWQPHTSPVTTLDFLVNRRSVVIPKYQALFVTMNMEMLLLLARKLT